MPNDHPLQINAPVIYEFVGANGKKRQLTGVIVDIYEPCADVLLGRQVFPWPIRLEQLRPAPSDNQQEARHVLC